MRITNLSIRQFRKKHSKWPMLSYYCARQSWKQYHSQSVHGILRLLGSKCNCHTMSVRYRKCLPVPKAIQRSHSRIAFSRFTISDNQLFIFDTSRTSDKKLKSSTLLLSSRKKQQQKHFQSPLELMLSRSQQHTYPIPNQHVAHYESTTHGRPHGYKK